MEKKKIYEVILDLNKKMKQSKTEKIVILETF